MDLEKIKSNFQIVVFLLWAIGSPTSFALVYKSTNNVWQALGIGVLIIFIGLLASLWTGLWERWTPRIVNNIDIALQTLFSGYQYKYSKIIEYQHRSFDIKGFTTQGPYTLDLEDIFIELRLAPRAIHEVSANPIPEVFENLISKSHVVWEYLMATKETKNNLAIIGPPGCGKTTLLRDIAITLVNPKRKGSLQVKKIPILLYLREHAKKISEDENVNLADLVGNTLKPWPSLTPPPNWFESKLAQGKCIILLDGLDEIADDQLRRKIVNWVEKQAIAYQQNQFVVTSRPYGYKSNPISNVTVFEILPLNRIQIEKFVQNWYVANELISQQRDDPGVRYDAQKGADDLISRLSRSSSISELAVNPLLLTLIATVHRYRSSLPDRRVELYAEICTVFLGRRQESKGIQLELTPAQKQRVLEPLAYSMMRQEIREIVTADAVKIITPSLKRVSPNIEAEGFLKSIEQQSGLVIERENGLYAFSHKTFQEYLAAVHILEENLVNELLSVIESQWWNETIRLYASQTDATRILEACLKENPPSINALVLAMELEQEALELSLHIRNKLQKVISESV